MEKELKWDFRADVPAEVPLSSRMGIAAHGFG